MNERKVGDDAPTRAIEVFQTKPGVLYSLEETARLTGVSRRCVLVYCRAGLVSPIVQPPYGAMAFTEEAVYSMRRIEYLHTVHGLDLTWIKELFDLREEVERLRAELRFLRKS